MEIETTLPPLSTFVLERIVKENPQEKKIVVVGHFECDKEKQAILVFEKTSFDPLKQEDFARFSSLALDFQNDIYAKFSTTFSPNSITLSTIYPSTPKHLSKYLPQPLSLFVESSSLYLSSTLPYILSLSPKQTEWVQNIIDGKAEADKVIYRDDSLETGHLVTIDFKWDETSLTELYCVALIFDPELRSIRDLNSNHLPLLKKLEEAKKVIADKYDVEESKIRAFFHYQPTYYRLHVHYTHVQRDVGECQKIVWLSEVINNINLMGDYYQKATLEFSLGEAHPLAVLLDKEKKRKREEGEGEGSETKKTKQ